MDMLLDAIERTLLFLRGPETSEFEVPMRLTNPAIGGVLRVKCREVFDYKSSHFEIFVDQNLTNNPDIVPYWSRTWKLSEIAEDHGASLSPWWTELDEHFGG